MPSGSKTPEERREADRVRKFKRAQEDQFLRTRSTNSQSHGSVWKKTDPRYDSRSRHLMPERAEVRYTEAGQGFGPRASNIAKRFKQKSTQTVIERRPQDEVLGEWLPENAECDVEEADELGVEESGESDEEEPASMARPRPILPRRTYKDVQRKMKVEDLHRWLPIMADQYTVYRHTLSGREPPDWEPSLEALYSGSRKKTVVLYDLKVSRSVEYYQDYWTSTDCGVSGNFVARGFIPASLLRPVAAFSIELLQWYVSLMKYNKVTPQGFCRALCEPLEEGDIYGDGLRKQFSNALDIYLSIVSFCEKDCKTALGRDQPHVSDGDDLPKLQKSSCALCFGGPGSDGSGNAAPLMVCLDGNNSLKRFKRGEPLVSFESKYRLPESYVDKFANQTISAGRKNTPITDCEKWHAAANDGRRVSDCFDERGYFTLTCQHEVLLAYADMVQECEGSKFPLALLKWLLEQYPGKVIVGYDIGCVFSKTFAHAPALEGVNKDRVSFVVGAFHAYAHDRKCQSAFNPRLLGKAGLENFEGNERLFSFTNTYAASTRHSSKFHRHQTMELAIDRWNHEKAWKFGAWLSEREKVAEDEIVKARQTFEKLGHGEPFYRQLIENEKAARATGRSFATEASTNRRLANTKKLQVCKAYVNALDEFQRENDDSLEDLDLARMAWDDPQWDNMNERLALTASLVDARSGLVAYQAEGGNIPTSLTLMRQWMFSDEAHEARLSAVWQTYEAALDDLEIKCRDRVEAFEKRKERMGYRARGASSVSVNLRMKDSIKAYQTYLTAYLELPPSNTRFKIPDKPWEYEEMNDLFMKAREGQAFAAEDWAQPEHREGIRAVRLLDCAVAEVENLQGQHSRLHSWMSQEPVAIVRALARLEPCLKESDPSSDTTAVPRLIQDKRVLSYYRLLERFGHIKKIIDKIRFDLMLPYRQSPIPTIPLQRIPGAMSSRFVHSHS